ncbi:MAG: DNA methyltransferase [Candidatus Microsaccharimonas sp.]
MYIAILGRQPALSIAELERVYGHVDWFSEESALVETDSINIERLGGTQKAGRVTIEFSGGDWRRVSMKIVQHYSKLWAEYEGKLTLGISAYGFDTSIREVQKTGLLIKSKLKGSTASLRLIPNQDLVLSTATSHHNKLGLSGNKIELIVVRGRNGIIVAESTGAQNITALAARDQGRPRRDAFVGMLPPKLAQIMINLAGVSSGRILDPFCGTGVILQEARLLGYDAYGTDLAEKMVSFSKDNLAWLDEHHGTSTSYVVEAGDATDTTWKKPIDAVVAETYLGQPFSAPPSSSKLAEVRGNCNHIISEFLKNLGPQLTSGTPVVLAIPAWKDVYNQFTHLPLVGKLETLGFEQVKLHTVHSDELLYFRPDQVVARELLILKKK